MKLELEGKCVLITGASKGIGLACARRFAQEGAGPIHLVARTKSDLERAQKSISEQFKTEVLIHPLDLSKGSNVEKLLRECSAIDILINNAGAIPAGTLFKNTENIWRESWDLKVFGYINMCRVAYQNMKSRGGGVIVNIIGAAGERVNPEYITGSTGNASLMAFSKALGGSSKKDGIRVVALNPGLILTDRLVTVFKSIAKERFGDESRWEDLTVKTDHPPGEVEDIADLTAFLACPLAGNITGTVVTSDGGWSNRSSM